jgi:hypothetical protein
VVALKRHHSLAQQPEQKVTLARLLSNATFTSIAIDSRHRQGFDRDVAALSGGAVEKLRLL